MADKTIPNGDQPTTKKPDAKRERKPLPDGAQPMREPPTSGSPENTLRLGDTLVEIKPTKLKYQRNRTAMLYKLLDIYPLSDILAMESGAFGEGDERDGDKAVYDWLVAVIDDEALVIAHYDEMDTDTIERLLAIYKRLNRVDEKDAQQKKLRAAAMGSP